MNKNEASEASRLTYIIAWVLSSVMITLATFIPDKIAAALITDLYDTWGIQAAYAVVNAIIGLISIATLIFVYACFRNVYIQKVMPYFWLGSVLGFIVLANDGIQTLGVAYERLGLLYIDLGIQFVAVFSIYLFFSLFWQSRYYPPLGILRTKDVTLGTSYDVERSPEIRQVRLPEMSIQDDQIYPLNQDEIVKVEGTTDYYDSSLLKGTMWLFYSIFFIIASWNQLDFNSLSSIKKAFAAYPQTFIFHYLGTAFVMTVITYLIARLVASAFKSKLVKQLGHIVITILFIVGMLQPILKPI